MYTYSTADHVKRVEKRSTANGVTRLEVTETWQGSAENAYARGRTRMTQGADGVQTWYDYASATDHGALYHVTAETRVAGAAVPGRSTRNVSYITAGRQHRAGGTSPHGQRGDVEASCRRRLRI